MRTLHLLSALGLSIACAHPAQRAASAPAPADYFPLSVGNEWVYLDSSPQLAAPRERVVRIVSRDAEGYFHDTERGALRADSGCVHDRLRRLLCAPVETGHAWISVVSASSTEHYEIAGVDEQVRTPAGTFARCVRVRAHNRAGPDTDQVLEMSYAPGVGPVKLETWVVVKGAVVPQVRAELKSYRIEAR